MLKLDKTHLSQHNRFYAKDKKIFSLGDMLCGNKLSEREGLSPAYTIDGTTVTVDWSANGYRLPTAAAALGFAWCGLLSKASNNASNIHAGSSPCPHFMINSICGEFR